MFLCVRYSPHIKVDSARFVPKFELSKLNETSFFLWQILTTFFINWEKCVLWEWEVTMWRENDFFLLHNNQYALYLVALFLSLTVLTAAYQFVSHQNFNWWRMLVKYRNLLWLKLRKSYCCVINHTCHTGLKLIQPGLCWWDKPHFRKCASLWNCLCTNVSI